MFATSLAEDAILQQLSNPTYTVQPSLLNHIPDVPSKDALRHTLATNPAARWSAQQIRSNSALVSTITSSVLEVAYNQPTSGQEYMPRSVPVAGVQDGPGKAYRLWQLRPEQDPSHQADWQLVHGLLERDAEFARDYAVTRVVMVNNATLNQSFLAQREKLDNLLRGGTYQSWVGKQQDPALRRQRERALAHFAPLLRGHSGHSSLLVGFRGCSCTTAERRDCVTGYVDVAATDPGYFGRGIYFTPNPAYAALYSRLKAANAAGEWVMELAWLAVGDDMYPITRAADYTSEAFDGSNSRWFGKALGNTSAFCVGVKQVAGLQYQACPDGEAPTYMEVVVKEQGQAVPRALVYFRPR